MAKEGEGRRKKMGMGRKVKKATIELDGCLQVEGSTPSILTSKVKTRIPRVCIKMAHCEDVQYWQVWFELEKAVVYRSIVILSQISGSQGLGRRR
jgi:hypothetical protein